MRKLREDVKSYGRPNCLNGGITILLTTRQSHIASLSLYIFVIVLSFLFLREVIVPVAQGQTQVLDSRSYVLLSYQKGLSEQGLYHPLRTLGYPVFLSSIRRITPQGYDWMEVAKNVQFGIHTLSAFLALGIVVLLRNQGALIPSQGGLLAFTLVQLNPILLSCSRQILTDSICVLFVTLFCYAILSRKTWMWGIGGISLGVAALVRPFYLNFALAVAVSAALYTFLRNRGSSYLIFNRRMGTRVLLIIECFAMIISIQYIVVYRYTNLWAFVGPEAKQSINVHYRASIYSYKYETYIGVEPHRAPLHYSSTTRRSLLPEGVSKEFRFPDWCRVMLGDPAGTLAMIMIKTTGLFQSYEWSPFRQTLKLNARHPAFICGLILFIGFVFIVIVYVADKNWLNTGLRSQLSFDFLFIISTLHIFIYSILTAPESRFIYPVVPILSVCAIHAGCLGRKKSYMVYAMIISVVLYSVTYQIMRDSQM